jgi:hypothetical protein
MTHAACPPLPDSQGLGPLDRERVASVADEGGRSAAAIESPERDRRSLARTGRPKKSWRSVAVIALGTATAWLVVRSMRGSR